VVVVVVVVVVQAATHQTITPITITTSRGARGVALRCSLVLRAPLVRCVT